MRVSNLGATRMGITIPARSGWRSPRRQQATRERAFPSTLFDVCQEDRLTDIVSAVNDAAGVEPQRYPRSRTATSMPEAPIRFAHGSTRRRSHCSPVLVYQRRIASAPLAAATSGDIQNQVRASQRGLRRIRALVLSSRCPRRDGVPRRPPPSDPERRACSARWRRGCARSWSTCRGDAQSSPWCGRPLRPRGPRTPGR